MNVRRSFRALSTSAFVITFVFASAGPAHASSCETGGVVTTVVAEDDLTIGRDDAEIQFTVAGEGVLSCGSPTVTTINTINVIAPFQDVTIDLSNGPIGPGIVDESPGTSEIEIVIDSNTLLLDVLVIGSSGSDDLELTSTAEINLNGDDDTDMNLGVTPLQFLNQSVRLNGVDGVDTLTCFASYIASVQGGLGNDVIDVTGCTLDYRDAPSAVTVDLSVPSATGGDGTDTITGFPLGARGSSSADTLTGADDGNHFEGLGGSDSLIGGTGNDTASYALEDCDSLQIILESNEGTCDDDIDAFTSIESATGSGGTDDVNSFVGDAAVNHFSGGMNDNTYIGKAGNDSFDGNGTSNTVSYAAAPSAVTVTPTGVSGGWGDDTFSLASAFVLSAFDDVVHWDSSVMDFTGGGGTDLLAYDLATEAVSVDVGAGAGPNAGPFAGFESLEGSSFDDTFTFGASAGAALTVDGGAGTDLASFALRSAALSISLDDAANDGASGEGTNLLDFEDLTGGSGNDTINGNAFSNVLLGGAGVDAILGRGGADVVAGDAGNDVVNGGSGDDRVEGGANDDSLVGGDGDDRLLGGDGNDSLNGSSGDDDAFGETGNDTFVESSAASGSDLFAGGGGTDIVSYAARSGAVTVTMDGNANDGASGENDIVSTDVERVYGGAGADRLTGNAAANYLKGNGGNDIVNGGAGADTIVGDAGNDTFVESSTASGADTYSGGSGTDLVTYAARSGAVTVILDASANDGASGEGDKVLTSVERVYGGAGADTLTGSSGANYLRGNGGNDTITGGTGADSMIGDAGNDRFYARDGVRDTTISGGSGTDKARRDTNDPVSSIEGSF